MDHRKIAERFSEAAARIEKLFYLAAAGDELGDELAGFFEDEEDRTIESCFGAIPFWVQETLDGGGRLEMIEAIVEWLFKEQRLGFLIQVATPVMKITGNRRTCSWGHYATTWFYADTLEEAIEKSLGWVAERREAEGKQAANG